MSTNTDKLEKLVHQIYIGKELDMVSQDLQEIIIHLTAIKASMRDLNEKMEEMVDKI